MTPRTLLLYSAPHSGSGDEWMTFLPIGLGYLQSVLKGRGYPCRLANLSGKTRKEVLAYLRSREAEVIGVSMFTFNRKRSMELLRFAREAFPGAVLVAGGPHPTHLAAEVFEESPELDAIIKGEGEWPLLGIAERMARGEAWQETPGLILRQGETPSQPPVEDLDVLGFPAETFEADFMGDPQQLGYLSTSRGCPATCSFCNTPEFWGASIRFRSADAVLREMAHLRQARGLIYFSFRDDTFTARKSRTLALMEGIQASGLHPVWNCQSRVNLVDEDRLVAMKRAGCEFIQFGVEHASERVLKLLDKGTNLAQARKALALSRKVGLNRGIYLITGIPGETWEDVEASAAFIRETRPQDVQVAPLAIYPGTRLFARYAGEGRIQRDFFRTSGDAEVFARVDAHTEKALRLLEGTRSQAAYTPAEFAAQKQWLGFCAVTNLLCGEAAEQAGRLHEALDEYEEIIRKEPRNPWGFLRRAMLRHRMAQPGKALADLDEVLALAPGNPVALELKAQWGSPKVIRRTR